jgi:hypothetical protein
VVLRLDGAGILFEYQETRLSTGEIGMDSMESIGASLMPWAWAWFSALMLMRILVLVRRGYRAEIGLPKGSPRRGILYSLSFSMLPWKKDSPGRHPWTYIAGMGMHVGVFATVLFALGRRYMVLPEWAVLGFGLLAFVGLASALGLFLKRSTRSWMRPISNLDDFFSNFLVQLYLLGGALTAFVPEAAPLWRWAALLLLVYIPLGKIFHMLLFFVSRILFGLQFGRRGVLEHGLPVSY